MRTPFFVRLFLKTAALLLLITATAKFISLSGSAYILETPEPLLGIPFRDVFWIVATIETIIAIICLFGKREALSILFLSWLATNFVAYRTVLWTAGWHKPCSCLGNLTDALHIPPQTADTVMKIVLAYLLLGSYASLFWLWRQRRKASAAQ